MFLFYIFWEAVLVPAYFLIGSFGGPRRVYAAGQFFVYTLAGGLLMLVGIIALFWLQQQATGTPTFDYQTLVDFQARRRPSAGCSPPSSPPSPS